MRGYSTSGCAIDVSPEFCLGGQFYEIIFRRALVLFDSEFNKIWHFYTFNPVTNWLNLDLAIRSGTGDKSE